MKSDKQIDKGTVVQVAFKGMDLYSPLIRARVTAWNSNARTGTAMTIPGGKTFPIAEWRTGLKLLDGSIAHDLIIE